MWWFYGGWGGGGNVPPGYWVIVLLALDVLAGSFLTWGWKNDPFMPVVGKVIFSVLSIGICVWGTILSFRAWWASKH